MYAYATFSSWLTMDSLWQSCSTGAVAKDDTTVRGTEEVHYPAHVESVRVLRPELEPVSLEGHLEKYLIVSGFTMCDYVVPILSLLWMLCQRFCCIWHDLFFATTVNHQKWCFLVGNMCFSFLPLSLTAHPTGWFQKNHEPGAAWRERSGSFNHPMRRFIKSCQSSMETDDQDLNALT